MLENLQQIQTNTKGLLQIVDKHTKALEVLAELVEEKVASCRPDRRVRIGCSVSTGSKPMQESQNDQEIRDQTPRPL